MTVKHSCWQALGLKSDDTFTAEMLTSALQEECLRLSSAPDAEFFSLSGMPHIS